MGRHVAEERQLNSGLSSRYIDNDGIIITATWDRAVEGQEIVGTCRAFDQVKRPCTGYLKARERYESSKHLVWYEAECMRCGAYAAAPNGKALTRSSARSEMPQGEWDRRIKAITKLFGKASEGS
jgi:hypothetical protein